MENDCKNAEESQSDNSSELAGLTRGAAKTAQSMSKRAIIGRIPKPRANAIKVPNVTAAGSATPRFLPKQVRLQQQVAKVTDRLSTAIDSFDALQSSNDSGTNKGTRRTKMSGVLDQMRGLAVKTFPMFGGESM